MTQPLRADSSLSRNALCGCGSGRRVKNCCGRLGGPDVTRTLEQALVLQGEHRLDEARQRYERVLQISPDLPDALHMLGVIHLQTGNVAHALVLLRRAAEAFGWAVPALAHNLGLATATAFAADGSAELFTLWERYDAYRERQRATRLRFDERVSVVVPSFNHARYVGAAIDSLRMQTRLPDEVIVIDDGSGDDSASRIRGALADFPAPTTLRVRANRGAAETINEAIAASSGDFVGVLNSDDRFAPSRLAAMIDAVACTGAEWGFSRVTCIDEQGTRIAPHRSPLADRLHYACDEVAARDSVGLAFLSGNPAVSTGNLFFSRSLYDRVGGFADLRYNHDWDFCLRAAVHAEPVFVSSAQYDYRVHGANTIVEPSSYALAEMQDMFARFYDTAVVAQAPDNPFAPLPCIWGRRFFACALTAGHATMLPPRILRDCADRASELLPDPTS